MLRDHCLKTTVNFQQPLGHGLGCRGSNDPVSNELKSTSDLLNKAVTSVSAAGIHPQYSGRIAHMRSIQNSLYLRLMGPAPFCVSFFPVI